MVLPNIINIHLIYFHAPHSHELAVSSVQCESNTNSCQRKEVLMTSNQIAYFKAKIEEEHYGRSDAEQARSNRVNEALTAVKLENENAHYLRSDAEAQRSNKAREQENYRSNRAKEDIEWAQIPARNAEKWSSVAKNYADAERSYAEAGLKYAETAFTDVKAQNTIAETSLTRAQTETEHERTQNMFWDTQLKQTQGQKNLSDIEWAPFYAFQAVANGVGGIIGNFTRIGGNTNVKTQPTGKTTERWYSDGKEYTNINFQY